VRIRGFAPSTPCWVELASPDPGASADFYAQLFDWKTDGGRFLLRDFAVAGLTGPRTAGIDGWLMHLSTDDLEISLDRVIAAGGLLQSPPAVVGAPAGPDGRAAVLADPAGAALGLWQRGRFGGAQLAGEPGTMCWSELSTADAEGAATFYGRAFDWWLRGGPAVGSDRGEWLTAAHDSVAGLAPAQGSTRWHTTFEVEDCARAAAVAQRLGGRVLAAPTPGDVGSYAELADPFGATFAVMAPAR
jgi:predicted enzyme related to lactoylglutathione lyase